MGGTIGIALKRDRGHADHRRLGKAFLQVVVFWFAFRQSETPAIIVNDDVHMIRIVERPCGAIERCIVKLPFWRSELPNEFRKVMSVLVVPRTPTLSREIVLVPPLELGWGGSGISPRLAADQITAHGYHSLTALGP